MLLSKIFNIVAISTTMLSIGLVTLSFVAPIYSEAKYAKPKKSEAKYAKPKKSEAKYAKPEKYKDKCKWVTIEKRKVCIKQ
jgi:hypothetical protein